MTSGPQPLQLDELLEAARAAARAAGQLLATARPSATRSKSSPRDLVTEWDLRSEELIRRVLEERVPGIPVLGEEGGQGAPAGSSGSSASSMRWLVDPIDGTVNFAHGLPIWSVSIGLEDAGDQLVGVVSAPLLGWWFEASRGGGARDQTGERLAVSSFAPLDRAMLVTGFPYDLSSDADNNLAEWDHLQRRAGTCRRLGCASIDLCLVARGWADGYWERGLSAWDLAAGAVIAKEAGATVTDTRGGRFDPHSGDVAATNGAIHAELIAELGLVEGARRSAPD
jgi:myo-inositol-1(or 4)-monophosphatase